MQVGAVALKERMRRQREKNIEVAGRPDPHPGLALAREPDAGAVLDAGRDIDRQHALAGDPPGPGAGRARTVDNMAAALAGRAGPFQGEKALGMADAAGAPAGRTGFGVGAALGAGARAGLAGDRCRDSYLRLLAGKGLVEANLEELRVVKGVVLGGRPVIQK